MIPEIVHTFWMGAAIPAFNDECIERSVGVLRYKHIHHITPEGWAKDAAEKGQLVNACNYMRLKVLYEYGGVYIDSDVQVLKPFNLEQEAFIGFQRADTFEDSLNTAVMGSIPRHPFVKRMMEMIEEMDVCTSAQVAGCTVPTNLIRDCGIDTIALKPIHVPRWRVSLYPREWFHPFDWKTGFHPFSITPNTRTIHYWSKLW